MVNRRLVWHLEKNKFLSNAQCGFRQHRSTVDHLVKLEGYIQNAFLLKQHVIAVFFDLEKAYDTAWRFGILRTLHGWGYRGHLPIFMSNFMQLRSFRVRLGNILSDSHQQQNGVPQGSVLSVTLFAIAINNIVTAISNSISASLYVDDFAIYYKSQNLDHAERQMQININNLSKWALENGFKFSTTKTSCVHFTRLRGIFPPPELYLKGSPVPVTPSVKFLGITLDSKLSWLPHIRKLRTSCERSMNILRILTSSTWGGDRSVMLRLYQSLIRSKLDYGSFIYGSASRSNLRLLDTIHHKGIRLASGAFRTSRIESLYAESGEPSLTVRRNILLSSYAARLAAQPLHPTYNVFFRPPLSHRYELNSVISRPAGIRFRELLSSFEVRLPRVSRFQHSKTAPWLLHRPMFDLSLSVYSKSNTPAPDYRQYFRETLSKYTGFNEVYTDGSVLDGGTGCAFYCNGRTRQFRLQDPSSVFSAEIYAIHQALLYLSSLAASSYLICSDSLSAIYSIMSYVALNPQILKIQSLASDLLERGFAIIFLWVPGHVGLAGNELADTAAKNATQLEDFHSMEISSNDFRMLLKHKLMGKWELLWADERDNKLRHIKSVPRVWKSSFRNNRREEIILTRLRIGHTHLTHGFLLRGEPPPICPSCGVCLSVIHVLLICPQYDIFRRQVNLPNTLQGILGDNPVEVVKVFLFLKLAGLYSLI